MAKLETTELRIGRYTLSKITVRAGEHPPYHDRADIWFERDNGEGMSMPVEDVEKLIDQFYRENF